MALDTAEVKRTNSRLVGASSDELRYELLEIEDELRRVKQTMSAIAKAHAKLKARKFVIESKLS